MDQELIIRLATIEDVKKVFELSNDDLVRTNSINQDKIKWEEHVVWFNNRIKDVNNPFYIVEDKNQNFIAQVRIDKKDENVISISLTNKFRGKNLSSKIIKLCSKKSKCNELYAYIKKENLASQKTFEKAGFVFVNKKDNLLKYKYRNNNSVYIITEMSANHCGDKELAKKIIKTAKEVGADAVKIQTYTADTITINCDNEIFKTEDDSLWAGQTLYQLYQKAYTPWEWQGELKAYADDIGIDFFSTPFDYTAVDFLESINVPMYKIASFEAIDYPLIKYVAKFGKPMIISVGISSLEEIQEAIDACKSVGNNDITILKCTSAYPAKLEDMNLITIKDMIERFSPQGVKIGLSDHSMSIVSPISAVAMGARVIEKHLTIDRALGGEDSGFSLNKEEFAQMVKAVRETEKCLGNIDYTVNQYSRKSARSLFAVKDIKKGEKFTSKNVRSIRPSNGLHPKYYDKILGMTANCDINFGTPLQKEQIREDV